MKIPSSPKVSLSFALALLCGASMASGASLYWDTNGTTLGAGAAPTGTWGSTFSLWNSDSTGGAGGSFTDTTTSADDLFFSAAGVNTSGTGAYTVTLSGAQAASSLTFQTQGASTVTSGTLSVGAGGITGAATAFSGSTRGAVTISSALNLLADQNITNFGTTALTLSGGLSGTANLGLKANGTGAISITTAGANFAGTLANSGTGSGTVTVSAPLGSGVTGLTQNSATSQLTVSGSNSAFTGSVSILQGTLALSSTNAVGSSIISLGSGSGANNATLTVSATTRNSINVVAGNTGTATINVSSALTTGTATLNGGRGVVLNLANLSTMTQKIVENGGSSAVVVNANAAKFNAATFGNSANSYTGGTTINNNGWLTFGNGGVGTWVGTGTLTINGAVNFNQQSATAVVNGIPALVLNNDLGVYGGGVGIGLSLSATTTVNLGATGTAVERVLNVGSTMTVSGVISDGSNGFTKSLNKADTGVLILAGSNNYTGGTTITSGTLKLSGAGDRLPTGTVLTVKSGTSAALAGVFDLNAQNQTVGGLAGDNTNAFVGTVTNSAAGTGTAILAVNPDNTTSPSDTIFAGAIKNGATAKVALTKNGSHALILAGANTYTGQTLVNAGSLLVASGGSISGSVGVTVAGGATFGSANSNASSSSLLGSSTALNLSLGSSAGTQSTVQLNLYSSGVADAITVSQINLASSGNIRLSLNDTTGGSLAGNYTLMTWTTVGTNFDSSTFASQITLAGSAAGEGTLSVSGNSLVFTAVPEPSATALLFGGLGIAFVLRRFRRC